MLSQHDITSTHPFAMIVHAALLVAAALWALRLLLRVFRIVLAVELMGQLILDVMVLPVLFDTLVRPEERLAPFVLAMVMLNVLHLAALEAAALTGVKVEQIVAPDVVGDRFLPGQLGEHQRGHHGLHGVWGTVLVEIAVDAAGLRHAAKGALVGTAAEEGCLDGVGSADEMLRRVDCPVVRGVERGRGCLGRQRAVFRAS